MSSSNFQTGSLAAQEHRCVSEQQTFGARRVTDQEKFAYARHTRHLPMVLFGVLSGTLLIVGLCRFAVLEAIIWIALPFVALNGTYLFLSYGVMLLPGTFRWETHRRKLAAGNLSQEKLANYRVDVFLPICDEDPEIILETWASVHRLIWPGELNIYVLDDSTADVLRTPAAAHGFHYLRRAGRPLRKAGNLRHAFQQSSGDFILLLDADFCPRPEMLLELVPELIADRQLAIVQSPQYFDVRREMNWIEAGAGFVQELFYRLIQPARDRCGAAVCVGSCAVYRRTALQELGGTYAIDHSEDLWTGFELMQRGWKIRYIPLILAKGLCPNSLESFFRQQARWCRGSLSLVLSRRFWTSRLSLPQKFCYFAGFVYYLATAINCLLTPLPPVVMVCLFPEAVHWNHLAFSILALIYTPFVIGWWSTYHWGLHFLTTREVSGAAHLSALVDIFRRRPHDWITTGHERRSSSPLRWRGTLGCLLISSALGGLAVWIGAVVAICTHPNRWAHFLPPLLFSTLHLAICWRALEGVPIPLRFPPQQLSLRRDSSGSLTWGTVAAGLGVILLLSSFTVARAISFGRTPVVETPPPADVDTLLFTESSSPFSTHPDADFGSYGVTQAFPGQALQRIIRMREHPARLGTYFLADYTGRIQYAEFHQGKWTLRTVADLTGSRRNSSRSNSTNQADLAFLYSFEVHPRFPVDPRLFLTYHTAEDGKPMTWRVTSLAIDLQSCADPRDEELLIEQPIDNTEHMGGDLAFDQTGCLLISCGDHESSLNDRRSQLLDRTFDSGILRIDVDQRGGSFSHPPSRTPEQTWTAKYFIPNDNPFVGQADVLEEYWALGLRNPFRIDFDPLTGKLWIGDVGQDRMEQVEVAQSGTNHQWSFREGSLLFEQSHLRGRLPARLHGTSTPPLHEYPHEDLNTCIVGGTLYRGDKFPELKGRYLFGDNRSGRIWSIDPAHPKKRTLLLQLPFGKSSSTLVSISTDHAGEIYFTSFVSVPTVLRLARAKPMNFPARLSETGIFTDVRKLVPGPGVLPYDVNVPLWSDGMEKQRWIRLPAGKQVDNTQPQWKFPPGTLLIKHFAQGVDFEHLGRPVETRVLVVREDGSTAGACYLWNRTGTDADLQTDRTTLDMLAGSTPFSYHLPSFRDCKVCHHRDNPVLGFNEEQLNHQPSRPGASESSLIHLSRLEVLRIPYSIEGRLPTRALASLDDISVPLERRIRSYLHANCSFCHHQNGLEHVRMNLSLFPPPAEEPLIKAPAQLHYHRIDGQFSRFLIAPGDLSQSAIYQRLRTTDPQFAMPYLGRTRPDERALQVLADWILSLSPSHPGTIATTPVPSMESQGE